MSPLSTHIHAVPEIDPLTLIFYPFLQEVSKRPHPEPTGKRTVAAHPLSAWGQRVASAEAKAGSDCAFPQTLESCLSWSGKMPMLCIEAYSQSYLTPTCEPGFHYTKAEISRLTEFDLLISLNEQTKRISLQHTSPSQPTCHRSALPGPGAGGSLSEAW